MRSDPTRRDFFNRTTAAGAGVLAAGFAPVPAKKVKSQKEEEEEVSPAEDLMREHGVLKRVLLV